MFEEPYAVALFAGMTRRRAPFHLGQRRGIVGQALRDGPLGIGPKGIGPTVIGTAAHRGSPAPRCALSQASAALPARAGQDRSEERCLGQECVRKFITRCSPYPTKKN